MNWLKKDDQPGQELGRESTETSSELLTDSQPSHETTIQSVFDRPDLVSSVLDNLDEGVVVMDERGECRFCNRAAERIFGMDLTGASLRAWSSSKRCFLPDTQTPCATSELPAAQSLRGQSVRGGEIFVRDRTGSGGTWLSIDASPLTDESGNVVGSRCILHDITELKKRETALKQTNRQLRQMVQKLKDTRQQVLQQERLRALGEMASGIAHDFNNALTVILGCTEMLKIYAEGLEDNEKWDRQLGLLETAGEDAERMVRRLREFYRSRDVNEDYCPISLSMLIEQVVSLTEPKWRSQAQAGGASIVVHTELADIPAILGNETEIREALTNLTFNAVDAMPEGGTLTLRTRRKNTTAVLEVVDTGIGMTKGTLDRCLDPFYTTKGEGGTGLGLAMAFGIINRHQGSLNVSSQVDEGTTVTIELPTAQEAEPVAEPSEEAATRSRPLNVLIVDDDAGIRQILAEYLAMDGHIFQTARTGREGLEKFRMGWFDIVITDLAMPDMNGDRLAAALKRIAPSKPVAMLTGFAESMKGSGDQPSGVDRVFSKPVTLTELRDILRLA